MNHRKNRIKKIVIWLLALTMLLGTAHAESMTNDSDPYAMDTAYLRLVEGWCKSMDNVSADVVFLGDSLTLGGAWEEYFPDQMIVNLGVVGDVVNGVTARTALIAKILPSKCFVMAGVNDLAYSESVETILDCYDHLLDELKILQENNHMTVYVQSVLPVNEDLCRYGITNQEIQELDQGIEQLTKQHHMTYIDIYPAMLDHNGMLARDYTVDGLHLSWQGYVTWCDVIQPYIDE